MRTGKYDTGEFIHTVLPVTYHKNNMYGTVRYGTVPENIFYLKFTYRSVPYRTYIHEKIYGLLHLITNCGVVALSTCGTTGNGMRVWSLSTVTIYLCI